MFSTMFVKAQNVCPSSEQVLKNMVTFIDLYQEKEYGC